MTWQRTTIVEPPVGERVRRNWVSVLIALRLLNLISIGRLNVYIEVHLLLPLRRALEKQVGGGGSVIRATTAI